MVLCQCSTSFFFYLCRGNAFQGDQLHPPAQKRVDLYIRGTDPAKPIDVVEPGYRKELSTCSQREKSLLSFGEGNTEIDSMSGLGCFAQRIFSGKGLAWSLEPLSIILHNLLAMYIQLNAPPSSQ